MFNPPLNTTFQRRTKQSSHMLTFPRFPLFLECAELDSAGRDFSCCKLAMRRLWTEARSLGPCPSTRSSACLHYITLQLPSSSSLRSWESESHRTKLERESRAWRLRNSNEGRKTRVWRCGKIPALHLIRFRLMLIYALVHHGPGVFTCLWKGAITPRSLRTFFMEWMPVVSVRMQVEPSRAESASVETHNTPSPRCSHFAQYREQIKKKKKPSWNERMGISHKVIMFFQHDKITDFIS